MESFGNFHHRILTFLYLLLRSRNRVLTNGYSFYCTAYKNARHGRFFVLINVYENIDKIFGNQAQRNTELIQNSKPRIKF